MQLRNRGAAEITGLHNRPPPESLLPGTIVSICLLVLSGIAAPAVLEHVVSLNWRLGNMRPLASAAHLSFAVLACMSWLLRRRVTQLCRRCVPTTKHLAFTLIGLAASLLVGLLVAEGAMRLLHVPFHTTWTPPETRRAQFDPEIGWVYIPNWSGIQYLKVAGEQQAVPMHFDEIGARVGAPGVRHDGDRPTILFVGCSFTVGYGVPHEQTFVGQLELQPGLPLQVVNLGVEAYGTDQALLLLKRYFHKFNTKAVVYTFIADHVSRNDNYDRRFLFRGARFVGTKPLFGLDNDGQVYLRQPPLLYEDLAHTRLRETVELAWTRWGPKPTLDLTRKLVQEMKTYVVTNGAAFVVVVWDWDGRSNNERVPFRDPELTVINAAANAPPDWVKWRIPGDSHPDERAHARIANLIGEKLDEIGLAPQ